MSGSDEHGPETGSDGKTRANVGSGPLGPAGKRKEETPADDKSTKRGDDADKR